MGDTVNHRTGTWKNTLWVVLRLIFCAILLPGSCLHLHPQISLYTDIHHGTKSGTLTLKYKYFKSSKVQKVSNLSK